MTGQTAVLLNDDEINVAALIPQHIHANLTIDNVGMVLLEVDNKLQHLRNAITDDLLSTAKMNQQRMDNFLEFCRTGKYPGIVGYMSVTLPMQETPEE